MPLSFYKFVSSMQFLIYEVMNNNQKTKTIVLLFC